MRWPDESMITRRAQKNKSLIFIQNLFYNAGIGVCALYMLTIMIVQPLLHSQTEQRIQLSTDVLLRIRKCVSSLERRLKETAISSIGFNEEVASSTGVATVEKCTQTDDFTDSDPKDEKASGWVKILTRLQYARGVFDNFNKKEEGEDGEKGHDRFLPLKFQVQSLNSKLLSLESRDESARNHKKSLHAIREMKGWVINGKVR